MQRRELKHKRIVVLLGVVSFCFMIGLALFLPQTKKQEKIPPPPIESEIVAVLDEAPQMDLELLEEETQDLAQIVETQKRTISELHDDLIRVQSTLNQKDRQISFLQEQLETFEHYADQASQAENELEDEREIVHQLQIQLEEATKKLAFYEGLSDDVTEIKTALLEESQQRVVKESESMELSDQLKRTKLQLKQMQDELLAFGNLHEQVQEMKEEDRKIKNDLQRLQHVLDEKQMNLEALEEDRFALNRELENSKQKYLDLFQYVKDRTDQSISFADKLSSSPDVRVHTVKKGETLRSISKQYYSSPGRWIVIYEANREQIPDQDRVREGTKLLIP